VELLLGVHRTLEAVVEELTGDRRQGGVGRAARFVDDAGVDLEPLGSSIMAAALTVPST
jgi:hypothetical protein